MDKQYDRLNKWSQLNMKLQDHLHLLKENVSYTTPIVYHSFMLEGCLGVCVCV